MSEDIFDLKARFITSMSNSVRIEILYIISQKEASVSEIYKSINISQSALSQHLAKLRAADLVSTRREAQTIFYKCDNIRVQKMLTTLKEIFDTSQDRSKVA